MTVGPIMKVAMSVKGNGSGDRHDSKKEIIRVGDDSESDGDKGFDKMVARVSVVLVVVMAHGRFW